MVEEPTAKRKEGIRINYKGQWGVITRLVVHRPDTEILT